MATRALSCGELSEDDLYEALGELSGYVDVTPGDLRRIYELAWRHAVRRVRRSVRVREVMTRDVATVGRGASAAEAAETMAGRCVSGLPVLDDDGRVAGVLSERDLLPRAAGACRKSSAVALVAAALREGGTLRVPLEDRSAGDLMTAPAVTVREGASVADALALLAAHAVNRLPVVDDAGKLVGIVTRGDLVAALHGDLA